MDREFLQVGQKAVSGCEEVVHQFSVTEIPSRMSLLTVCLPTTPLSHSNQKGVATLERRSKR
jgi:hypothetical protein